MNEDGPDFGGVEGGIEQRILANLGVITAEQGAAVAPATAAGDERLAGGRLDFSDGISLIGDELSVNAERGAEGAIDLRGSVVVGLQTGARIAR